MGFSKAYKDAAMSKVSSCWLIGGTWSNRETFLTFSSHPPEAKYSIWLSSVRWWWHQPSASHRQVIKKRVREKVYLEQITLSTTQSLVPVWSKESGVRRHLILMVVQIYDSLVTPTAAWFGYYLLCKCKLGIFFSLSLLSILSTNPRYEIPSHVPSSPAAAITKYLCILVFLLVQ